MILNSRIIKERHMVLDQYQLATVCHGLEHPQSHHMDRDASPKNVSLKVHLTRYINIKDYRPISLIVIAKVLANRLQQVVHSVVSDVQTAYLKGRQITHGPLMVNGILSWALKKKEHLFVLKADFEKACDSLDWRFLDNTMKQMRFSDKWRMWIRDSWQYTLDASNTFSVRSMTKCIDLSILSFSSDKIILDYDYPSIGGFSRLDDRCGILHLSNRTYATQLSPLSSRTVAEGLSSEPKLHLAPASSWSTLPNRSLLCSLLPVGIGRCSCVIVKEISAIWLNLACFFRHQCVLAAVGVSEEDQNNLLRFLDNKESEYMRLQMHKMGVDDFELLTMIWKGAFGEVRICREKITSSVYAMGAYFILRLQAQKMYGNTWTDTAKVVSGTNKENNVADMNTNKGETTNGILLIDH
nr:serine/threonine-protein kinase tricorner-like [Tanacetum cinerariifolium]